MTNRECIEQTAAPQKDSLAEVLPQDRPEFGSHVQTRKDEIRQFAAGGAPLRHVRHQTVRKRGQKPNFW